MSSLLPTAGSETFRRSNRGLQSESFPGPGRRSECRSAGRLGRKPSPLLLRIPAPEVSEPSSLEEMDPYYQSQKFHPTSEFRRHGNGNTAVTRAQLGGGELDPIHKKLAQCLQQNGDELDGNVELQRMIDDSQLSPSKDIFMKVAIEIFADGKFNWGRVVALFYFACRLVIKALVTKLPDIIRTIISWTMDYLQENVINWIREQGGWEGIRSHFGTPTWQTLGVFLAGVLTTVLVIRKL
ncbi:LOW QUALITY PROTEIN: apoptosis regulator BAX-like [Notothenia coriiceps]|uniref:LOW QUALITY PROTEIN: apoptosis regulator BAX-like n=1 Tax=Notothenia coriiceps TaxID=8208 RepID=A0A6I9MWN2_9TELE|nr:PREDICTED: LOW QUALITY PROTEIN: apoptosis regulator BAX-like [Notothenia coriiceps]